MRQCRSLKTRRQLEAQLGDRLFVVKKRCPWLWQFWNAIPCQRLTIHRRLWGTATLELLQLCLNQKIGAVPEDAYDIVKINMQREKV
jgi:hypothetical protein